MATCALVGTILIGCGVETNPNVTVASGRITMNGTPLKGGSIHFSTVADDRVQTRAMIKTDGTFTVESAPLGDVLIAVETESLKHGAPAESFVAIPLRYGDPKTSDLKHTIINGKNEINIDLKDK